MSEERDRIIDRLLRRGVASPRPPGAPAVCLDGEQLAAWAAGTLPTHETARVEEHLADCARCQSMMAAFVRSAPALPRPEPWWRSLQLRWLVPLAATAVVAAVWVALPERESEQLMPAQRTARNEDRTPAPSAESTPPSADARALPPQSAPRQEPPAAPEQKAQATPPPPEREASSRIVQPAAPAEDATGRADDARRERAGSAPAPLAAESLAQAAPPPPAARAAVPSTRSPVVEPPNESVTVTSTSPLLNRRAPLGDVVSSDNRTRWRVVSGTAVQRSVDGGTTWRNVEFTSSATLYAGHSPTPSLVWLVGQGGTIYLTTDGARFERVAFIDTADLVAVTAISARDAMVTTVDGRRFRTVDGGATWTPQ